MTAPDLKPTFYFDRYINGVKMAEDVCVERASSLSAAMVVASKIASRGPNGEAPVLVYRAPVAAPTAKVPEELIQGLREMQAYLDPMLRKRIQAVIASLEPVAAPDPAAIREAALREAADHFSSLAVLRKMWSAAEIENAILTLIPTKGAAE